MKNDFDDIFSRFEGRKDELIPLLQSVQEENGYLSHEAIRAIGRFTNVGVSQVFGVATFYAQFRFKPKGETHIMVCRGTACHVKGAPRILEEIENQLGIKEGTTSDNLKHSIESVACIGACSLAPCVMANGKVEANLTPQKIRKLFKPLVKKK